MAVLFTLLTNCVPDPVKFGTGRPNVCRVFLGRIAEPKKKLATQLDAHAQKVCGKSVKH